MVDNGQVELQTPRPYLEWNDKIAASVFRRDMAGREVLLCVTSETIDTIGGYGSEDAFVEAVKQGAPWADSSLGLCQNALRSFEGWRVRGLRFPPYIGYLALFVLAVGVQGDFAANEYYARLRTLLRWSNPDAGTVPSFQHMHRLWDDLEIWSQEDMDGELGIFNVRIAGKWAHVGLPKAQAVFTEAELRALPAIFAAAALDPTSVPPSRELARSIRQHGTQVLRYRTLDLLGERPSDSQLSSILVDTLRTELQDWDGTLPQESIDPTGKYNLRATARICVRVDEIAQIARFRLRVRAKTQLPEDGLQLRSESDGRVLVCKESEVPGWSRNLTDGDSGTEVDAATFDWSISQTFDDPVQGWRIARPGNRVKIFSPASPHGLSGYVEVRGLEHNAPFLLAAPASAVAHLDGWTCSGEVDLKSLDVIGLPSGWRLFRSDGAKSDHSIVKKIPELALPSNLLLRLEGGIRSGSSRQNSYFNFAPPLVVIEGATSEQIVVCEGRTLEPTSGRANAFALPRDLPTGKRLNIEALADGEKIRRQSLYLTADEDSFLLKPLVWRDDFGVPSEIDVQSNGVAGVLSDGPSAPRYPIRLSFDSHDRRFLIGRRPGEVVKVFTGMAEIPWEPIWIVELTHRRGQAIYCGTNIEQEKPALDQVNDPDSVDSWKEILFYKRGKINAPASPRLARMWKEYVSAASKIKKGRYANSR
jgi:hypothetical protein